jgi:hypothetical protein
MWWIFIKILLILNKHQNFIIMEIEIFIGDLYCVNSDY